MHIAESAGRSPASGTIPDYDPGIGTNNVRAREFGIEPSRTRLSAMIVAVASSGAASAPAPLPRRIRRPGRSPSEAFPSRAPISLQIN